MTIELLIKGLKHEFAEASRILDHIDQSILCAETPINGYGPIGEQYRHIINYGDSLLRDWQSGLVDFTNRDRDPNLETNKSLIKSRLEGFQKSLDIFKGRDSEMPLGRVSLPFRGGPTVRNKSSLGGVIDYVSFHVNHHTPLIVSFALHQGITIEEPGGIAPDTLAAQGHHCT